MAVNQVIYGSETLIDLTSDTVTPDKLFTGVTAHSASGEVITGTASVTISDEILCIPIGLMEVVYD
jgi:hypothetical protein